MKGVYRVGDKDNGRSLALFLKENVTTHLSMKSIKKMIESKHCYVNGRLEVFASYALMEGDVVEVKALPIPMQTSSALIYEDPYLYILDKPSGVVSSHQAISAILQAKPMYSLIHRLDKETSGLLMIAKDEDCMKKMKTFFEEKKVQKYYLALVHGIIHKQQGTIDNFLASIPAPEGQIRFGEKCFGQRAITHWRVLQRGIASTLVLLMPVTGRTHQLRVHMSGLNHPILGDHVYNRGTIHPHAVGRIMLHAMGLRFIHPYLNKEIFCFSLIPSDFVSAAMSFGINKIHFENTVAQLKALLER